MIHLEEEEVVEDHSNIVGPVEEVAVEALWIQDLCQDRSPLTNRYDMQNTIEEPDALGGWHAMVKLHEQLDGLKKEEVVELGRNQALVLVEGREPTRNQLEWGANGLGIEGMSLLEYDCDKDIQQILIEEHGACCIFQCFRVEGNLAFFKLDEHGF